jgi:hypothetical protein
LISAGAVTGVHTIVAGQSARVAFAGGGEIKGVAHAFGVAAQPGGAPR